MEISRIFQDSYYYIYSVILFLIGMHTILSHANLFKKVVGLNIMDGAIFLLFVSSGYIDKGSAPILVDAPEQVVNPVPSALILTGIVVSLSITAYALSLIIKLYGFYGTMNADEIAEKRKEQNVR